MTTRDRRVFGIQNTGVTISGSRSPFDFYRRGTSGGIPTAKKFASCTRKDTKYKEDLVPGVWHAAGTWKVVPSLPKWTPKINSKLMLRCLPFLGLFWNPKSAKIFKMQFWKCAFRIRHPSKVEFGGAPHFKHSQLLKNWPHFFKWEANIRSFFGAWSILLKPSA